MRSRYGAGKPKAAHDRAVAAIFGILAVLKAVADCFLPWRSDLYDQPSTYVVYYPLTGFPDGLGNRAV
jgi:hypothetical protein